MMRRRRISSTAHGGFGIRRCLQYPIPRTEWIHRLAESHNPMSEVRHGVVCVCRSLSVFESHRRVETNPSQCL
jgi:hypothetical protein